MAIIQANVPQAHLATAMGNPNRLLVEYSTDVLLPVPGPYLTAQLRRDFLHALMIVNEFFVFAEDARRFLDTGEALNFPTVAAQYAPSRSGDTSNYGLNMKVAARDALRSETRLRASVSVGSVIPDNFVAPDNRVAIKESLFSKLAAPNQVFREMFDKGVLVRDPKLFNPNFAKSKTFNTRCAVVLRNLLSSRDQLIPQAITPFMRTVADQVTQTAKAKHPSFLREEFAGLTAATNELLIQWFVVYHRDKTPVVPDQFTADLTPIIGFPPSTFTREWALSRKERMELAFGTPDLRGPLGAEPVAPQGFYRREDYRASQDELSIITAESRRTRTGEVLTLGRASLRRELNTVYYAGAGTLNQLTSQASNSLLSQERRAVVLSMIREVSESRENASVDTSTLITSSTITREAAGVDLKRAATHHRFKVVVPVMASVEMYDATLTWSPRVFNPFFALRQAIYETYNDAYRSYLRQYYVTEPVSPPLVWERYILSTDLNMERENAGVFTKRFTIPLQPTDREDHPDLTNATVVWNQSESFWNDDPDHFTARLTDLAFSGSEISGRVRLETDDSGSDFQGFAHIEVPVLRYSQDTVNAFAQHELEIRDFNLKRQALEAQAHQYARIKEREFIERHERREPLQKIVFDALIRQICVSSLAPHISYYKEIIARTIDWTSAKMDFEPVSLRTIAYPDFEADHFVNSLWVRFFLPIIQTAEVTLFDALTACGSFQVRASVNNALLHVNAIRDHLERNGPDQIDQFSTEMVIGEHIEAVMSEHDMAS